MTIVRFEHDTVKNLINIVNVKNGKTIAVASTIEQANRTCKTFKYKKAN